MAAWRRISAAPRRVSGPCRSATDDLERADPGASVSLLDLDLDELVRVGIGLTGWYCEPHPRPTAQQRVHQGLVLGRIALFVAPLHHPLTGWSCGATLKKVSQYSDAAG
jgi:hypothetical protein